MATVKSAGEPLRLGRREPSVRIAIVVSHPIQYFAPWYGALAAIPEVALKVFFCCRLGAETYYDSKFGINVKWDIPLFDGYDSEFLDSRKEIRRSNFWATDNPNVGDALGKFHPQVVVVHGYAHRTVWRAVSWCNRNRIPVMLASDSNGAVKLAPWKRAAKAIIVKHFYRHLDGALTVGDNNRTYHLNYGLPEERIFAGTLPIDCNRLLASVGDAAAARRDIRRRYGIPEDAFVVIYAGKLIPLKCPLHLLQAIHNCDQRGLKVWGLLVGEGLERRRLESFLADRNVKNIVLTGFVNQSSIGMYYAASDAVALMSEYEPKGLVVPEAGCFGCPAILSDRIGCVGPTDSARPNENALVYSWADIEALTNCIVHLYKDQSIYRFMSEAAVRIAKSQDIAIGAQHLADAARRLQYLGCTANRK